MSKIRFKNGHIEDYTIVLSTRDYRHLGQLTGIKSESIQYNGNLNSANEFSFTLCKIDLLKLPEVYNEETRKKMLEQRDNLWELLVDHKLVWVKELDEYYEIKVSCDDSIQETIKTVTCTSLCEAELSQYIYTGLEINTPEDLELKSSGEGDSGKTLFCNYDDPAHSLLHRAIKDRAPHYSIGYVAKSLQNLTLVREFSVSGTSVYDFLTGEVAEQYNCLFVFDSKTRTISAYDLYTTCSCGYRGDFYDQCPKCENTDRTKMSYFGNDTTIFIDKNNLTDAIQLETDSDSVKNCLRLVAGDANMTAAIRNLNPNGSEYLYYINETQMEDMPEELKAALNVYQEKYNEYIEPYEKLVERYYDLQRKISYLTHGMMPLIEKYGVTADTEAQALAKAFAEETPMLALNSVTSNDNPNLQTVNSAMANYAKIFIKTGYVKVSANGTFEYKGKYQGENPIGGHNVEYHYGYWTGTFTITSYSDKDNVVTTPEFKIKVTDDRVTYIEQKVLKELAKADDDCSVYDVFSIKDDAKFAEVLKLYNYTRLVAFHDAYENAVAVLNECGIDGNITKPGTGYDPEINAITEGIFHTYNERWEMCENAMNTIQTDSNFKFEMDDIEYVGCIEGFTEEYNQVLDEMKVINDTLNLETNLGTELYKKYCAYRREDTYENQNYIVDSLDDAGIIEKAKDFMEAAKKELERIANPQYTISSTLKNFLVLEEFRPILDYFELGNWIRMKVDNRIYTLRLIGYSINFGDLQNISVQFSTVTKYKDAAYDAQQIIKSAQSMSSSFTYIAQQAKKGESSKEIIDDWTTNGLNSAMVNIKNNDETLLIRDNGMLFRYYDPDTGKYSPEQMRIYNNLILFTQDNWDHCTQAVGKHNYQVYDVDIDDFKTQTGYGMTAEFFTGNYVTGKTIIGGQIYSLNYSTGLRDGKPGGTWIDLEHGEFDFGNGQLKLKNGVVSINKKVMTEAMIDLDVTASDLKVLAKNIDVSQGGIEPSQLKSVPLTKITGTSNGQIVSDQINSISSDKINWNNSSSKKVPAVCIDENVKVKPENINGDISSDRIAQDLNNKNITGTFNGTGEGTFSGTLSGSFTGSVTLSSVTTTSNGRTYSTVSGSFTVGDMELTFVNGLLVDATSAN